MSQSRGMQGDVYGKASFSVIDCATLVLRSITQFLRGKNLKKKKEEEKAKSLC